MYKYLTIEQRIVILISRLTFSDENKKELESLLKEKIDWYKVVNYSVRNRVSPLLLYNLKRYGYEDKLSKRWTEPLYFHYIGTKKRNEKYLDELNKVLKMLNNENVLCAPLKGAYLIENVFKDTGIRTINDMDCMIKKEDIKKIREIMNSMGYIQGDYDEKNKIILPMSREKDILWKTKMSNLYPFRKIHNDSMYCPETSFDFTFSLDYDLNYEPIKIIMDRSKKGHDIPNRLLQKNDFFIHLCCHLFKEAVNPASIILEKDINLIKFCDTREYVLNEMSKENLLEAVKSSKIFGYEKALYFTLFYLKELYNDGYEEELIGLLDINDKNFINNFGERDFEHSLTWKKTFWERLFAFDNSDELKSMPKLFDIN